MVHLYQFRGLRTEINFQKKADYLLNAKDAKPLISVSRRAT